MGLHFNYKPNILFIFLFFCTVYSHTSDLICKHLCLKHILKAVAWKTKEEWVVNVEFCIMILKVMQDELKLCEYYILQASRALLEEKYAACL